MMVVVVVVISDSSSSSSSSNSSSNNKSSRSGTALTGQAFRPSASLLLSLLPPPHSCTAPGNGGITDRYVWTQQLAELSVVVAVPIGTRSRELSVEIGKKRLKVGVKGKAPIVEGELYKSVLVDDSFWTLGEY